MLKHKSIKIKCLLFCFEYTKTEQVTPKDNNETSHFLVASDSFTSTRSEIIINPLHRQQHEIRHKKGLLLDVKA